MELSKDDLDSHIMEGGKIEKKVRSAFSSVENSPLMDKESLLRYSASSRDEFWDALSSNYDYLMDDGLINTCREASSDLSVDDDSEISESACWSFKEFIEQFKALHDILHDLQIKEDTNQNSDEELLEKQQNITYYCKLFNEQAQKLSKRYPEMRDEVQRRLNILNNKWKAVEQSIKPNNVKSPTKDNIFDEITYRMSSLRKWLRELENSICTVHWTCNWTIEEKEENYRKQLELQKEIEDKGKHVSALLKLCERIHGNVRFGQNPLMTWDAERVRKVAENLEHKWHLIYLKSLESLCSLEGLIESSKEGPEKLEKSFSEEPLKKYPRLSDNYEKIAIIENEIKSKMSCKRDNILLSKTEQEGEAVLICELTMKNDKAVMVGDTGIAELKAECGEGKFEIIQDIGYSSETSTHLSTDEKTGVSPPTHHNVSFIKSYSQISAINNSPKLYLAPDKYPSISVKTLNILSDERTFYKSKVNEPKSVPDKFYQVTCIDDEGPEEPTTSCTAPACVSKDVVNANTEPNSSGIIKKVLNECMLPQMLNSQRNTPKFQNLSNSLDSSSEKEILLQKKLKRGSRGSKTFHHPAGDVYKKSERVSEWLNNCQSADDGTSDDNQDVPEKPANGAWSLKELNSSCDASGECTPNESDSEKSAASDVNNSVTLSQSFTGSIETVIPAVAEETTHVQKSAADPSPAVRMRKKRRARDRPWSVIETAQGIFNHASVPHSTSEGALDLLYSSQESGKMHFKSRKLSKSKRYSLTDVTLLCSSNVKSSSTEHTRTLSLSNAESGGKGSISDPSSDFCENSSYGQNTTLLVSEKDSSLEVETLRSAGKEKTDVIMNILPEISLSLETDTAGSAVNTEDQASISDQAWDEYQDPPYLSEPYSEQTADEDEVRKLINFGDDYWTVLGSYSDVSSVSLKVPPPKHHRSRTRTLIKSADSYKTISSDSNSDTEDLHNIMKTSKHALQVISNHIKENSTRTSFPAEISELNATCQTNLCHLNTILKELSTKEFGIESVSREDWIKLKELIKDWEELQGKILSLSRGDQKINSYDLEVATLDVHSSLAELKTQLSSLCDHAVNSLDSALTLKAIASNIQSLQSGLTNVQELKDSVLSVNARILRLIANGGGSTLAPLKEIATKLYQQWEDVYELHCTQLTKLQTLQSQWCESTEKKLEEDFETTIQWKPVQVGNNLPKAEIKCEIPHENTAAEIQAADHLDVTFSIQNVRPDPIVQCSILDGPEKEVLHEAVKHIKVSAADSNKETVTKENGTKAKKNKSCFWRYVAAAFPFQVALVLLYCISYFLDPQCCENTNNYDFTLLPQLRYFKGPPPA
ncbi:uncharacterized protein [Parasteatoda tepidariorum]|uniref:uncharacterized protein n=1 Tax=Parasteatoda tepidariorum TaxID=114398 RepID=UPI001C722BDF|nr:uncharacterized protein LOC107438976 [Parasteatoda tepidariorum]XP_015906897.2 uncharacterized protein LOC107438976 [Parasteatoda tepidariorum]XP_042902037.1 uncharacterized protein LOC107438976 [Parasteatoda tepidariorum]